jgi:F420-0:gamma-glutamyl ligase-like protein
LEYINNNKAALITVNNKQYRRKAIKTHFVKQGESYINIMQTYALPEYQEGDFISISEKIIALCQNRVVKKEDLKVGFWAKTLSKFASRTSAGVGVGEALKMQYAINKVGLPKILYASVASAITKLFGKKGVFYEIVGQEVAGLDGFYNKVWDEYGEIGIEMPENPFGVCNEIKEKLGISCMLVDANDLGQEILGFSDDLKEKETFLKEFIKDNPAGQEKELTPIILMKEINN